MSSVQPRVAGPPLGLHALASLAASEPDGIVIEVEGGDSLTYGSWERRSNALARGLEMRDVGAGDRVALLFDARGWADFAVAYLGTFKAGAALVLLSPGVPGVNVGEAIARSGAKGVLCLPRLTAGPGLAWVATPTEVERDQDTRPDPRSDNIDLAAPAELLYSPGALAPPRASERTYADLATEVLSPLTGWFVHAWCPGSRAGQHLLARLLRVPGTRAASLARFSVDGLCALMARRGATGCGLTPGLAAALVGSRSSRHHDLTSVAEVLLSTAPRCRTLRTSIGTVFRQASVTELDDPAAWRGARRGAGSPVEVSQEGMLWHEQFAPGSFNLPCLVRRYQGRLDVTALGGALSEMMQRNEALRSNFEVVNGEPRQVIRAHEPLELTFVDLAELPPTDRDAEISRRLAEATSYPFDLVGGSLFCPSLLRLAPDDHVLVVRLHHTVFDDWSVDVFRRELSALYAAFLTGAPSPLDEPAVRFSDYCDRQRARLDGEPGSVQHTYWRRRMIGAPLSVQLPIGDPDGGKAIEAGGPLRRDLTPELAKQLRALAPSLRATPFMTVLAAFEVLVARYTGQDDQVIATVVAHRDRTTLEPLIGCFAKKILLRLQMDGDPTFPDLVARVRRTVLGALEHQDLAFETVVKETLGVPAAALGVIPQVSVVFQGETPQQAKLTLPGVETSPLEASAGSRGERHFSSAEDESAGDAAVPVWGDGIYLGTFLILSLLETDDGMALVAKGAFHRPAVARLLDHFEALLADIVRRPGERVSKLSIHAPRPSGAGEGTEGGDGPRRTATPPAGRGAPMSATVGALDDDVPSGVLSTLGSAQTVKLVGSGAAGRQELLAQLQDGGLEAVACTVVGLRALVADGFSEAVAARRGESPPSLLVVCPSDPTTEWVQRLHLIEGVRLTVLYAPPGCDGAAVVWSPGHGREPRGRPLGGTGAHVLDSEGRVLPVGAVGELHFAGWGEAHRYDLRPSGHLARCRPDGVLELLGPADDFLSMGGFRLRRSRIERALTLCPGVTEAAISIRGGVEGEGDVGLVAYVVADAGAAPTLAQLRRALWASLPGSPWPSEAVVVEVIPRLIDGGIDRAALRAHVHGGGQPEPDSDAILLAELWTEAGGEKASPGASYWQDFSFLQVLAEARQAGMAITDEQVVRSRTPEMLAAALAAGP